MVHLVSILSEINLFPLVTNPVSTSPPVVLICVVLMISGSSSALTQSLLRLVILMVSSMLYGSALAPWCEVPPTQAFLGVGPIGFWLLLALFPVPEVFIVDLRSSSCLLVLGVFPSPLIRPPFLQYKILLITGPGGGL